MRFRARTSFVFAGAVFLSMAAGAKTLSVDAAWKIVVPPSDGGGVGDALCAAAKELSLTLDEGLGFRLGVEQSGKAPSGGAFCIGETLARRAGFDTSGLRGYDNVIAVTNGNVYLFGHDRPGRTDVPKQPWWRCLLPSAKAVTRFLETSAGVRYLAPGEVGKEVPSLASLSVEEGLFSVDCPQVVFGTPKAPFVYGIASGNYGCGPLKTYGGHTYAAACPPSVYAKEHPEYFALVSGRRVCTPEINPSLCLSNPAVEELIVRELVRQYDAGADVCQLGQQDGSVWCQCSNCRKFLHPDLGERIWLYHKRIAEEIARRRPGKVVHILSYADTEHPPKTFRTFPGNVMIELCSYSEEAFSEWRDHVVPHGFTVYAYLCGNYVQPGYVARHSFAGLAELAMRFRRQGVCGVYRCGSTGDLHGLEGPGYYLFNRLLQGDGRAAGAILNDYYGAAFGPAASAMRGFYEAQDERLRMNDKIEFPFPRASAAGLEDAFLWARPKSPLAIHAYVYAPETIKAMELLLSQAEKAEKLTFKQRKRLELVRLEFDYAKTMGTIAGLYAAYRLHSTRELFDPLADEIVRRNAWLDALYDGRETPRRLRGWPELALFGDQPRSILKTNGRLHAMIGAPLAWDVELMRKKGVLPGVSLPMATAVRADVKPSADDFGKGVWSKASWNDLGGVQMEATPMKARFKAVYDEKNLYVAVESMLKDECVVEDYGRDGNCWGDESVDLVYSTSEENDVVYQLVWNPSDASRFDSARGLVRNPLDPKFNAYDRLWNGEGWMTENRRANGRWRTMVTIPFSDTGADRPKPGDIWRFNVGRSSNVKQGRSALKVFALWSPNFETRSLRDPGAMGKLVFR